jgi:tRNA 2-selenouridine synthase
MQIINAQQFTTLGNKIPIVDVRSPAEFAEGHIPNAINIPLFDNDERAIIGTLYKVKGRISAIEKGLDIVGPKMVSFVRQALQLASSGELLVYCWRGGMRSESMGWLFERVDINCSLLRGGYKSYRNYLLDTVGNLPNLIVIEGYTGSGKTEILDSLRTIGEQVIDLEKIANHRGSAFGGIGMNAQPTTQQFQNTIFKEILNFDLSKIIWIEGESRTVGKIFLPDPLWDRMNETHNIEIAIPRHDRIKRLVHEYGNFPAEQMENAISSLIRRLGDLRMKEILSSYREKNLEITADKLLEYYDQSYQFSRNKYKRIFTEISLPNGDSSSNAKILIAKVAELIPLKVV